MPASTWPNSNLTLASHIHSVPLSKADGSREVLAPHDDRSNPAPQGHPKEQSTFARVSGYVEQNDIHSPQTTVAEALLFSASLRLPGDLKKDTVKVCTTISFSLCSDLSCFTKVVPTPFMLIGPKSVSMVIVNSGNLPAPRCTCQTSRRRPYSGVLSSVGACAQAAMRGCQASRLCCVDILYSFKASGRPPSQLVCSLCE